jgi:hypothetical protein
MEETVKLDETCMEYQHSYVSLLASAMWTAEGFREHQPA